MKNKRFDCVEMMHRGQEAVRKKLAGMTPDQELAYWEEATKELREIQQDLRRKGRTHIAPDSPFQSESDSVG